MKRHPKTKNTTLRKIEHMAARAKSTGIRTYYAMGRVWRVVF